MLRIKALEEEGFTFSSLTWLTASPQAPAVVSGHQLGVQVGT